MGLLSFVKGFFEPSPEDLERKEQERMRRVLVVMAWRRRQHRDDMPSFMVIKHELTLRMWHMPVAELIKTMRAAVDAGFVQRLDGGNKHLTPTDVSYVISSDGLSYVTCSA